MVTRNSEELPVSETEISALCKRLAELLDHPEPDNPAWYISRLKAAKQLQVALTLVLPEDDDS